MTTADDDHARTPTREHPPPTASDGAQRHGPGPVTSGWMIRYDGHDPAAEALREVLCTLGNGRFATRGCAPESGADAVHYPGTYAAGVFNRLVDDRDGRRVENESMVNLPDWQSLTFRVADGDWLDLSAVAVSDYVQELDLRRGVLTRRFRVEDAAGRRTRVAQRRLVSMADPYLAGLDSTFLPENWSGPLTVRSGLDGRVTNSGVARYRGLDGRHLVTGPAEETDAGGLTLEVETNQSRVRIGLAARHRVLVDGRQVDGRLVDGRLVDDGARETGRELVREPGFIAHDITVPVTAGGVVTVEKIVALYTSRDRAISEPGESARAKARCAPDFDELLTRHENAWDRLWSRCDLGITGPSRTSQILRLHVFHLLQTVCEHSIDLDVGIPARGLHGEAYRGHVFWDEVFVLPFLNLRMPEVSRAMLLYRWRRLPQARENARAAGHRGAMYPWQSGATGREETQTLHLNPRSGHWLPDNSPLQRHIGLAVAYNTWRFYEATGDLGFLAQYGAEMILDIAAFFAGLATYDRPGDRYDICGVMGPDEYHDGYPWRDEPGLDDNAYTSVLTAWTLSRALECVELLPQRRREELLEQLGVHRTDLEKWEHISRKLRLCWHGDGILSQFHGYERLAEFDWSGYRNRYGDISRLDRILEAEGDSTNRYQVSKQADVLMLFYLLTADELYAVLDRLGYEHDRQTIPRTVGYYLDRTSHGSTLSKVVHSWVLARTNRRKAWDYFLEALESDIADGQRGTTGEGIHLGAMAGTVDLLQRGFTGMETRGDALRFDPLLPDALNGMEFELRYRGYHEVGVAITHDAVTLGGGRHGPAPLHLRIGDDGYEVAPRERLEVPLRRRRP